MVLLSAIAKITNIQAVRRAKMQATNSVRVQRSKINQRHHFAAFHMCRLGQDYVHPEWTASVTSTYIERFLSVHEVRIHGQI